MQTAAKNRNRVLAETHHLLEDPLFAEASYSPVYSARNALQTSSFAKKQQQQKSLAKQMKAIGAAREEAKLEKAESDGLRAQLEEKQTKMQQLTHHAEQSAIEMANLKHQHDHLEAELKRMKEMKHSDETKAALKALEDKKKKLKKAKDDIKRLEKLVESAQNMTKQYQAGLKKEKAKSAELVAQEKSEVVEIHHVQKQVKNAEEERQMLTEEQQLLKELEKSSQEQTKLKQTLAEQTVKLQTMQTRLKEQQSISKEMVGKAKTSAGENIQHAEDEAEQAEAALRKARKKTEEEYEEREKDADQKFKAQQAKLDQEFEKRLESEEAKQKAANFYKLESLRSDVKTAEDELSAARKKFKEDWEDAEQKLAETKGELERENKAAVSRVEEQRFKTHRVQNRYLKQQRQAEAKLTASESQLRKVKEEKIEAELRLHQLQEDLELATRQRKKLEQEEEDTLLRIKEKEKRMQALKADAATRLKDQKSRHAAQLKQLELTFNETRQSVSEQVTFYERKLSEAHEHNQDERNDALKKQSLLHAALAKNRMKLLEAQKYLRKELKAAKLASEKVKAFKSHMGGNSALEQQEARVEEAVDRWRSSLESMKLDEEEQPVRK